MRIIRSVQDSQGNILDKQPDGGTGRTRCMKCQSLCIPQTLPDGSKVMQCQGCGGNYKHASFGAGRATVAGVVPKRQPK